MISGFTLDLLSQLLHILKKNKNKWAKTYKRITFNGVGASFVISGTKTPVNFKMLLGKPAAECRRKLVFRCNTGSATVHVQIIH